MSSNLFGDTPVATVVPVSDVIALTGTQPTDFGFDANEEQKLEQLIQTWVEETASNVRVRLGRSVEADGIEAAGMKGVLVRTVANILAVAMQQRSSPIIQLGDFATRVLNTGDALDKLDDELAPFLAYDPTDDGTGARGYTLGVFWSSEQYKEPHRGS